MARGAAAPIGAERWSPNGYHYTKTKHGWDLTSRILMEEKLGRPLLPTERVVFKNGNRRDVRIENLELTEVKSDLKKMRAKLATIQDKIRELQAMELETQEAITALEAEKLNEGAS